MRTRIGINLIALPNEKGSGAFRYIQMLLKAMGEYDIKECEFIVYKQKQINKEYLGIPDCLNVKYVNVPTLGSGFRRILFEQTMFYKYLLPCDVLYSYCTSMPLFARCKKVFTLHDVYYITTKQRYGWLQRTYLKWMTKLYCSVCERVITVSKFSYEEIIKYIGVSKEKLALTYNFILQEKEKKIVRPNKLCDVNGVKIDIDKPFFFYVGNLQPGKNIKGMIDGFLKFKGKRSDIQLIIAGKPTTYGDEMVEYVKDHKCIHYIGYQSRENVDWLLANCTAVVLLSFCEGFGIPPIEGFGFGRPALTSNTTSLPEVVGKAGLKVDPNNIEQIAMGFQKMLDNQTEYIKHIPEQLSKFNPRTSVEKFMDVLDIKEYSLKDNSILMN
ncbi:MAG: glycosyltransferase family 4 protein [Bacteroidales bacterium]|nr:glycosyltransferase family 4 protein [Candidatus Physcocola equi]